MVKELFALLRRPALWQRSPAPFWDDEHISKGMLEAHLNPGLDVASRKHDFIDRSVHWLTTMIPAGGSILDLGCGPGLYTKRLSDRGYAVTGMDISRRSVAYAREHDSKTEYILANYLELDFADAFDAVTLIYGDFAALTEAERRELLPRVHRALKPGGVFIFDVFTAEHFKGKPETTDWSVHENGGFWSDGPHIELDATYLYEGGTVRADRYVILTPEATREYIIWDTCFSTGSLIAEVAPFGFETQGVFGDVAGAPYTPESETLCLVARKA